MTARAIDRLLPQGRAGRGRDPVRRRGRRDAGRRGAARLPQQGRDDLPGSSRAREPGPPDRRLHDRGAAHQPGRPGRARRASARPSMLGQVGIDDGERRLRQYPHELSGGMLQRVMIAAALLTEPQRCCWPTSRRPRSTSPPRPRSWRSSTSCAGVRPGDAVHHARPGPGRGDLRPDRRHVRGADRGGARGRRCCTTIRCIRTRRRSAAARPDIAQKASRLRAIPGRPLSAFEAPAAECAFAPRCAYTRASLHGIGAGPGGARRRPVALPAGGRPARAAGGGAMPEHELAAEASVRPEETQPNGSARLAEGDPVLAVDGLRKEFGEPGRGRRRARSRSRPAGRWRSSGSPARARPRSPG